MTKQSAINTVKQADEELARDTFIRQAGADALDTAKRLITQDRAKDYGFVEKNFDMVAQYWTVYLRSILEFHGIDPETFALDKHDCCVMMSLFKTARIFGPYKPDNYDDGMGYLALAKGMMSLEHDNDKERQ